MTTTYHRNKASQNRQYRLLPYLQSGGVGTVRAMARHFEIVQSTVRNYIELLEAEGYITSAMIPATGLVVALTDLGAEYVPP